MQLSPNVEFGLRVAAIAVPAISAIVVALATYLFGRGMANRQKELNKELALYQSGLQASLNKELENHKRDLSKELEHYKADISKELEIHKLQLQSTFQTRFYEFQTRYSWLHQKRAEAIIRLYELVARVHGDLKIWSYPGTHAYTKPANVFIKEAQAHLVEMTEFFDQKRIFFDDREIARRMLDIIRHTSKLYSHHPDIENAKELMPQLADSLCPFGEPA